MQQFGWRFALVLALGGGIAHAQVPAPEQPPPEPPAPEQPPPEPTTDPMTPVTGDEIVVVGRVIDVLGKPVRGATITLEGSDKPIGKTDRKGQFTIKAPINATIVVESKAFGVAIATVKPRFSSCRSRSGPRNASSKRITTCSR